MMIYFIALLTNTYLILKKLLNTYGYIMILFDEHKLIEYNIFLEKNKIMEYNVICPNCNAEQKHLNLEETEGSYVCSKCGKQTTVDLEKIKKESFKNETTN